MRDVFQDFWSHKSWGAAATRCRKRMTPIDHRSTAWLYLLPRTISGATNAGVPHLVAKPSSTATWCGEPSQSLRGMCGRGCRTLALRPMALPARDSPVLGPGVWVIRYFACVSSSVRNRTRAMSLARCSVHRFFSERLENKSPPLAYDRTTQR